LPSILIVLCYLFTGDHTISAFEENPPLVLEGAEYVQQKLENGEIVIIMEGDVRWSRGENRLRCDRAKYYEERDLLYLSKDVRLINQNRRVQADSIQYIRGRDYAIAMGNVLVEFAGGEVVVRSDSVDYYVEKRESWAFKRPKLILREDDGGSDTSQEVLILGDHLHMLEENYLAIAGEVDISGDSLLGGADSLYYNLVSDRIVLLGSPWIVSGSYRLVGETLELRVPGRVLRRGISRGRARGEQRKRVGDEITNWIEADSIFLSFRDDRIDSLLAFPNARSYYRVERGEGVEENYVAGDEVLLKWTDRQLEIIRVKGRGEGVYLREEGEKPARNREEKVTNQDEG
jgi:lipopolysaccharide export system protein LptA